MKRTEPPRRRSPPHRALRQRASNRSAAPGFALIPALFLIVVLGALALVAIRVGTGQQQAVIMSLQQARALAAAQAGIEWGAYQAVNGSCVPSTTLNLTEAALAGFTVTVTCAATTFANASANSSSYGLLSPTTTGT